MVKRLIGISVILLLAAVLCIGSASAEVAGTERITLTGYSVDEPVTVAPGSSLKIPVTVSGFPRGLNQYRIEFSVQGANLSAGDVAVTLDRTMIQHTAASDPVITGTGIRLRYLQTVKMAAYPEYGVNETPVGTLTVHLPESSAKYGVNISARIVESTSDSPVESLATPTTGNISLNVALAEKKATSAKRSPISPFCILAGAGAALAIMGIIVRRNSP